MHTIIHILLLPLYVLLSPILFLMWYPKWSRINKILARIPGPRCSGLIGAADFAANPNRSVDFYRKWSKEFPEIFRIRILNTNLVVVTSPALAGKLMSHELGLSRPVQFLEPMLRGPMISTYRTGDPVWKAVRKGIMPAFASKHMKKAFDVAVAINEDLTAVLRSQDPNQPCDLTHILINSALDIISLWGYNVQLRAVWGECGICPGGADLESLVNICTHECLKRFYMPLRSRMFWNSEVAAGNRALAIIQQAWVNYFNACKAKYNPADENDQSLFGHLMRVRDENGNALPDDHLISNAAMVLLGGHDTSSITLILALYWLDRNPAIKAKLEAELDAHGLLITPARPTPRALTYADLSTLHYTSAVIKETLRRSPVAPVSARDGKNDIKLGDYTIPAGTQVVVNIVGMHEHYFLDGKIFRPERWLREDGTPLTSSILAAHGDANAKTYVPFGDGPRQCAGVNLAITNMPVTLVTLLGRFHIELEPNFDDTRIWYTGAGIRPERNIKFFVRPRVPIMGPAGATAAVNAAVGAKVAVNVLPAAN